jgi:hypothetical protein
MDVLTTHGMFALRPCRGRSVLPDDIELKADIAPALATAAVSLTGWMAECGNDRDLDEAAAHFRSLWDSGLLGMDELREEAASVINQILNDPELNRMHAELN